MAQNMLFSSSYSSCVTKYHLEENHARHSLCNCGGVFFRRLYLLCTWTGQSLEEAMSMEYLVSGIIAALLMIYLVYSLIKPEKF